MDFGREKGGRRDSFSAFGLAPYSPVPPLLLELLPSLLMKSAKGFVISWKSAWKHITTVFFLPVLGVGVLWEAGEPVLSGPCTTGVVCS